MTFKKQILSDGKTPVMTPGLLASPPFNQKHIPSYRLKCTACSRFFLCFDEDNHEADGKDVVGTCDICITTPKEFIGAGSVARVFEVSMMGEKDASGRIPIIIQPDEPMAKKTKRIN